MNRRRHYPWNPSIRGPQSYLGAIGEIPEWRGQLLNEPFRPDPAH